MPDKLEIGSLLGHYRIVSKIGSGGMGEVYHAADTKLDRQVALKILHTEAASDTDRVRRFILEAKSASALNHPNILTVHEIGSFDESHYIATELIKGETLRDRLHREPLTLRETMEIASQAAAALNAAHDAGIVHRDIKPENMMIRDDGLVKVLDFGLVKLSEPPASASGPTASEDATRKQLKTAPGVVMGTAYYMSPEQARGKDTDARSDIWSLGVVLFEMLTGQTPFAGETTNDSIAAILTKEPPALLESVPLELKRIIKKSLQKKADERYQTIKDLLLDLKNLKRELEFSDELERSHIPAFAKSSNVSTSELADKATGVHQGSNSTLNSGLLHHPSSAEYVVAEVRKHKVLTLIVLLVLALGSAGFGYWYLSRSSGTINAIAVLPFANVGDDPANEYLSDGMSESLINKLSQLPQLKVIARSSAFKYKGKEIDPQEVAKALGVEVIVTGRVTRRGESLNIGVEMINAIDKTHMWGETYDRKITDAQGIQEEIVRMVSEKLRVKLSGAQEQQLATKATQNSQAYHLYLNGLFYRRKGGFENGRKALDYYNQALALDPNFALAHIGAAEVYSFLGANSLIDPREANEKAKAAVQEALALDETLAEAHAVLATIKRDEWDWAGAEREFKRAIELNPNLARAHNNYAIYLSILGRQTESLTEIKRAREIDPLDLRFWANEGQTLYFARRYDEAIQTFQEILKIDPNRSITHAFLGDTFASKGEYAEAIKHYGKTNEIEGETTSLQCYLGYALAKSGKRDEALVVLDKLKTTKEYVSPGELAILYVGFGDTEQALVLLEKAYVARDLQLQFLRSDPHYDSLRADPRFQDLLRRVGLPE